MAKVECHVCGKPATQVAVIEGSRVNVCPSCSRYGESVVERMHVRTAAQQPQERLPGELEIIDDAARSIRTTRQLKGMTQAQLSARTGIGEHDIQKIEEGKIPLDVKLARKLEAVLGIKLIEQRNNSPAPSLKPKTQSFTRSLGDFLKK